MRKMDNKGQISAEYLLLVVVFIVILASVTIPMASKSIDTSMDVSQVSDAKTAVESIANAADVIYANGPGSKRTIDVYIPQSTNLEATGNTTGMDIGLSDATTKFVNATIKYTFNNTNVAVAKGWHSVQLQWTLGTNYIGLSIT